MKNLKSVHLLSVLFLIFFFSLGFLVTGALNTKISQQKQNVDTKAAGPIQEPQCTDTGGECQSGKTNEIGNPCTLSSGSPGTVVFNLCPNQGNDIRCCVPGAAQSQSISLNAALQGIGPNQSIKTPQRSITMKIYDTTKDFSKATYTAQNVVTYDQASGKFVSNFNLGDIAAGNYQMVAQSATYLDTQLTDKTDGDVTFSLGPGKNAQAADFEMKAGDLAPSPPGDNFVNIIDYNAVIGCMPGSPSSACLNKKFADINDDGVVNQKDLDILLLNFGENGFAFQTSQFKCEPDPACNSGKDTIQLCSLICTKKTQRG